MIRVSGSWDIISPEGYEMTSDSNHKIFRCGYNIVIGRCIPDTSDTIYLDIYHGRVSVIHMSRIIIPISLLELKDVGYNSSERIVSVLTNDEILTIYNEGGNVLSKVERVVALIRCINTFTIYYMRINFGYLIHVYHKNEHHLIHADVDGISNSRTLFWSNDEVYRISERINGGLCVSKYRSPVGIHDASVSYDPRYVYVLSSGGMVYHCPALGIGNPSLRMGGKWNSAPFVIAGCLYGLNTDNVLHDIRRGHTRVLPYHHDESLLSHCPYNNVYPHLDYEDISIPAYKNSPFMYLGNSTVAFSYKEIHAKDTIVSYYERSPITYSNNVMLKFGPYDGVNVEEIY